MCLLANHPAVTSVALPPEDTLVGAKRKLNLRKGISFSDPANAAQFSERIWTRTPQTNGRRRNFAFLHQRTKEVAELLFASSGPWNSGWHPRLCCQSLDEGHIAAVGFGVLLFPLVLYLRSMSRKRLQAAAVKLRKAFVYTSLVLTTFGSGSIAGRKFGGTKNGRPEWTPTIAPSRDSSPRLARLRRI